MPNILTSFLFDRVGIPQSRAFLDLAAYRHKLLSGNVANISTPGYEAKDINFKEEFARMTGKTSRLRGTTTDHRHIPLGQHRDGAPNIERQKVSEGDLNSVDIDREVPNMARNELLFTIGARLLQKKFDGMRNAIKSG